jgi:F-type H+-transporting ATPase subunit delta
MARGPSTTARRYAEAIFEIAERDKTVDTWLEQLDRVAGAVLVESVVRQLEDPQIAFQKRHDAFSALFHGEMLKPLSNLLALVLRRRRLDLLPDIAHEFRRLYNRREGIVEATAVSAAKLDQAEIDALRQRLEKMTGGRVELAVAVDPALLGGIQVRLGDLLIDGSVRGRLERLRGKIVSGAITS